MNIYLHVEISSRELDSKLLLATLAASRGHDIIVSDWAIFNKIFLNMRNKIKNFACGFFSPKLWVMTFVLSR